MQIHFRLVSSFVLVALLAACTKSSLDWASEEHHVRRDAQRDELLWLEIERGLTAGDSAAAAASELVKLLAGARVYPPGGGWLSVDLDEFAAQSESERTPEDLAWLGIAERLTVAEVGLFEDQAGSVSLFRLWRVREASAVFALINEQFNRVLAAEDWSAGELSPEFPVFDARTREMFSAHAKAGGQWIRWNAAQLELDAPMTSTNAARCVADIIEKAPERAFERGLWSQLTDLRIADERCTATLAPAADGAFHFTSPTSQIDFDAAAQSPELAANLRELALSVDTQIGIEGVRAKIVAK